MAYLFLPAWQELCTDACAIQKWGWHCVSIRTIPVDFQFHRVSVTTHRGSPIPFTLRRSRSCWPLTLYLLRATPYFIPAYHRLQEIRLLAPLIVLSPLIRYFVFEFENKELSQSCAIFNPENGLQPLTFNVLVQFGFRWFLRFTF